MRNVTKLILLTTSKRIKELKMSDCYVADQIAKHCDEEEIYCPECGDTMTYDIDGDLVCDNEECGNIILTGEQF